MHVPEGVEFVERLAEIGGPMKAIAPVPVSTSTERRILDKLLFSTGRPAEDLATGI